MLELNFSPFPELETEKLFLRRIKESDIQELFWLRSDKRVMKYIDRPLAQSTDDVMELFKKIDTAIDANDGITWGITTKQNDILVGTIGFWRIEKEHYRAEIGYLLHPDLHGKGLMHEAIVRTLAYGFENMKLHSVEANVNPQNEASIKLLEKNSFAREAYFKEDYYYNGNFMDTAIYSLLNISK